MKAKFVFESVNFERGMDPKDSMELGDVEGREKRRKKAEFAIRRDEIYNAAKKLSARFSRKGHSITTSDEISFYKVTFRTRKWSTYIIEVTYFAPNYELIFISKNGRETRLSYRELDTLIHQIEYYEKNSHLL